MYISCLISCSGYTPMLYYSFLTYCFIIYFLIQSCIVIYFHLLYFSYTVICHILSILSSHNNAMLLISCHIFYTCHFLLGFMSANTLEADTGNNCMYPKVLSLYETVISICIYPKVSSLYEIVTFICMT